MAKITKLPGDPGDWLEGFDLERALERALAAFTAQPEPQAPEDFRQAHEQLRGLEQATPRGNHFRNWHKNPDGYFTKSVEEMDALVAGRLNRFKNNPSLKMHYETLSPLARAGVYLLLEIGVTPSSISVLLNQGKSLKQVGATPEFILESLALLSRQGVVGLERVVQKCCRRGFLEHGPVALSHIKTVLVEVLDMATNSPEFGLMDLFPELAIDWSQLPKKSSDYFWKNIYDHLPEEVAGGHLSEKIAGVDFLFQEKTSPRPWLVDVQTSANAIYDPRQEQLALNVLQVFRHALLVTQHDLAGIEYVIQARKVAARYLSILVWILEMTGVNYLVRVEGSPERRLVMKGGSQQPRVVSASYRELTLHQLSGMKGEILDMSALSEPARLPVKLSGRFLTSHPESKIQPMSLRRAALFNKPPIPNFATQVGRPTVLVLSQRLSRLQAFKTH